MNDLISRQDAIDAVERHYRIDNDLLEVIAYEIRQLSSAQPEHPKGKWIRMIADGVYWYECSECHEKPLLNRWLKLDERSKYCPNCGADMRGEEE